MSDEAQQASEAAATGGLWDAREGDGPYAFRDGKYVTFGAPPAPVAPEPEARVEAKPAPQAEALKPDRQMTSTEKALAELKRFPQLLPGAAEKLAPVWAVKLGGLPPDQRAGEAVRLMESPTARKFLNPEYVPPKLPTGADPSPVRATLARYADRIAPGQLDALTAKLSTELAGRKPPLIASSVVRFLGSDEAKPYLNPPPGAGSSAPARPGEQARAADGRFSTPPSKPAEKKRPRSTF